MAHDVLGYAAKSEPLQSGVAVRRHDNQICALRLCGRANLTRWTAVEDQSLKVEMRVELCFFKAGEVFPRRRKHSVLFEQDAHVPDLRGQMSRHDMHQHQ